MARCTSWCGAAKAEGSASEEEASGRSTLPSKKRFPDVVFYVELSGFPLQNRAGGETKRCSMQQRSWARHPTLHAFWRVFLAGKWVTRSFGRVYMMVGHFAVPMMTMAAGYLMLYAIDTHHGLAAPVAHPSVWDSLATAASGIINVTPERVFPGTVGFCMQALLRRQWLHAALYAVVSLMFAVLTIMLLAVFMTGDLTNRFLSGMLLWRAISALSYTVVAEVRSHHQGEERSLPPHHQARLDELAARGERLAAELSHLSTTLQERLQESAAELASSMHVQLISGLAALRETRLTQPLKRKRAASVQATEKRPGLQAHPGTGSGCGHDEQQRAFDVRAFIFSCLQERPEAKLAEMKSLALARGHVLSQATISRYRKQLLARRESSALANDESTTMQGENAARS